MELSIFILTWNTQSVCYNTKDGPSIDFSSSLKAKITNLDPDLIVIGLQEDTMYDSQIIPVFTQELSTDYKLLHTVELSGWGSTTYKAMKKDWTYLPRGLRLAVLSKSALSIDITRIDVNSILCPGLANLLTYGKGGVVINLHTSIGQLCFLNVHLPFNSRSLIQDPEQNFSNRQSELQWQAHCLCTLYNKVITDYNPENLFIIGDLNFRVQIRSEKNSKEVAEKLLSKPEYIKELINSADELNILKAYSIIPPFKEGVGCKGPRFMPTCKLRQGRDCDNIDIDSFLLGKYYQRTPSWCDRILYLGGFKCQLYERWEEGNMNYSDHAAVISHFRGMVKGVAQLASETGLEPLACEAESGVCVQRLTGE